MDEISYNFLSATSKMTSLNETQSSENKSISNDMSYLYGRDPSILAYGQRPFPSKESKKNLYSLLEEEQDDKNSVESRDTISSCATAADAPINQTIRVFLRMKPLLSKIKLSQEQTEAYSILNSTTLLTKMPSMDNNTSCLKRVKANELVCRKFIFTQTFDAGTSQLELFEQAVKPQMIDFLAGKNSIVMSYGTTNSGKTYTLQGTPESPGIIPRGIEFVFSQIKPRGISCYKPVNLCDVIYVKNYERNLENEAKIKLLALNPADKNSYASTYNRMQELLHQESPMRLSHASDAQYSVWVSFAEIYNETIYDLLWNDCHKKRPALKLATDSRGRSFIKGLKSICVSSGAEAYQVLMAGQYNLKVAATALNSRSSRSHCIFTIKLLKYRNELDPNSVEVSIFSFCDLAGSERLKKTLNVGDRLKEAQNINTSLLVLGRCLKTIYESQTSKQKNESIGPFRESKLTRLFQRALSGKEQLALIVNVNPMPNLYIETQNVLNFSAIAKKIVIQHTNVVKRRHSHSRFSRLVTQSMKTEMDWENTELDDTSESPETEQESDIDENDQEAYEDLLTENELLKKEIKELKASALLKEAQTRQEMTDVYTEIMKKLEADWKSRLIDMEEQQEDLRELAIEQTEMYYKNKLNQLNVRKRSRSSVCEDEDDDKQYIDELEAKNTKLEAKLEMLKKTMRDMKQSKDAAEAEKTKLSFELAVTKEDAKKANEMLIEAQQVICSGDDVAAEYVDKLLEKIKDKDEKIKIMKTFLNEAKEEYISITGHAHKMEIQLKEQQELLAENIEQIRDLEEQLSQANMYSTEQSKVIENLEEELDQQTKKLIETEEKVKSLTEQLLASSSADNKDSETENCQVNEDYVKAKLVLQELKMRLEFSEKENSQIKEELSQRTNEVESLKSNLDLTKSQLDKVTEKVGNLSITNKKPKFFFDAEQEIPTEANDSSLKEPFELKLADTSCQTAGIENSNVETDEKWQQTSLCLDESHSKNEIIHEKDMIIEENIKAYHELEKKYDEIKNIFEILKIDKEKTQKQFEENIQDLQTQITELTDQLKERNEKICLMQIDYNKELDQIRNNAEKEIQNLKKLTEFQNSKCEKLMAEIEQERTKEEDKDSEIKTLETDLKKLIQKNEQTVQKMESEMKSILQDLTMNKEKLAVTEEKLAMTEERKTKMDKEYRQVIHILEMKLGTQERTTLEKQLEAEKLKLRVEEMKKARSDAERELDVFTKNRNETMEKYEDLVNSLREELNVQKKEVARLQDLLQEVKENTTNMTAIKNTRKPRRKQTKKTASVDNTSEDDHIEDSKTDKKTFLSPNGNNIPLIELSGSESKRLGKSTVVDEPAPTRVTRKKRLLFTALDESFVDIEQTEPSPSPKPGSRSLRNRRR